MTVGAVYAQAIAIRKTTINATIGFAILLDFNLYVLITPHLLYAMCIQFENQFYSNIQIFKNIVFKMWNGEGVSKYYRTDKSGSFFIVDVSVP